MTIKIDKKITKYRVEKPGEAGLISVPERTLCAGKCHHVPHVHADWSVDLAWPVIVGKGHERTVRDAGAR